MRFPFRYTGSLATGTHIISIPCPGHCLLTSLYIEVDNTVTISDDLNIINGANGSPNSLSLESVFNPPVDMEIHYRPIRVTIVTTTTTKVVIYADLVEV